MNESKRWLRNTPNSTHIWLLTLGFYWLQPVLSEFPSITMVWLALAMLAFLGCYYIVSASANLTHRRLANLGMVMLGIATATVNVGANTFFIFASAHFGHNWSMRIAVPLLITNIVLMIGCYLLFPLHIGYFLLPGMITSIIIGIESVWVAREEKHQSELKQSQQEIQRLAAEAERERIGRDLHDILGHTLSVVNMRAQLAERVCQQAQHSPEKLEVLAEELKNIGQVSRDALKQVREAVSHYRHVDLASEFSALSLELERHNIVTKSQISLPQMSEKTEAELGLILRELITNVLRHSKATQCQVGSETNDNQFQLWVNDNGVGQDIQFGNGLTGIVERVKALNGSFSVTHKQGDLGQGTYQQITIPVEALS
ncbi:sensor histidine kinase [Corallincola platygyrae]|uniref:Sensor histidine kinase n=1 Tax=Corallincola platygyrae TaxID=1193278 RepID=A0ABW4XPR9_9GAMM